MDIQELKLNLYDKLASVTDVNLIHEIHLLITNSNENKLSEWEKLSNTQQKGLIEATNEMNNSVGIDHNIVIEKYKKKYE
jgi:hypothetical protein